MSDYKTILVEIEDGVGIITLNRPEVLNALSHQLTSELHAAAKQLDADSNIGCIVITGAGEKAFSAGGDIHEQRENDVKLSQAERDKLADIRGQGQYELAVSRKPTIGMMNGLAYGGASVLATLLDMRIGCDRTRFRYLGAQYGRLNSTWSLSQIVGTAQAKELLFSARVVQAEEAARMGLLNHLVPQEKVLDTALELARQIANNPPEMVQGAKQLLHQYVGDDWEAMFRAEREAVTTRLKPMPVSEAFSGFLGRKGH